MKLYVFSTVNWGFSDPKFTMEEFEVEEKNKTYVSKERRFLKSDIGIISGFDKNQCILLENNPSEAARILLKGKERKLEKLQNQMNDIVEEMDNLKKYIDE